MEGVPQAQVWWQGHVFIENFLLRVLVGTWGPAVGLHPAQVDPAP